MLLSKLVAEATSARRAACFGEFIEVRAAETREFVVKLDVLLRGRERELRNTHGSDVSVEGFCRKIGFTVKNFHNRFPKLARERQLRRFGELRSRGGSRKTQADSTLRQGQSGFLLTASRDHHAVKTLIEFATCFVCSVVAN